MTGLPGWARYGWGPVPYPAAGVPEAAPVEETSVLREQAEYLKEALADVERRLSELESEPEA
jgi:hypothetical protein